MKKAKRDIPEKAFQKLLHRKATNFFRKIFKDSEPFEGVETWTNSIGLATLAALLAAKDEKGRSPHDLLEDAYRLCEEAQQMLAVGDYGTAIREGAIYNPEPLTVQEVIRVFGYKGPKSLWKAVERTFGTVDVVRLKAQKIFSPEDVQRLVQNILHGKQVRAQKGREAKKKKRLASGGK